MKKFDDKETNLFILILVFGIKDYSNKFKENGLVLLNDLCIII
jgi:hypothetical protein